MSLLSCSGKATLSPLGALFTEFGTINWIITIAKIVSTAVNQNRPLKPKASATIGPKTIAKVNDKPINIPMVAITFGRCSSRLKSAANANTALAIAPVPCNARPKTTP